VPTLVLAGEADLQFPPPVADAMARRIPRAELQVWPGQAHQPFQEEPAEYNARLETFWARVES
jgi:pimeloyl-ACP methyl ester carboxylesterase